MSYLTITFLACAFLIASSASAQTDRIQTVGTHLLERQREIMTPSVAFCAEQLPSRSAEFHVANERFRTLATQAFNAFQSSVNRTDLSKPVPSSKHAWDSGKEQLKRGKVAGANTFCPLILQLMSNATADSIQPFYDQAFSRIVREQEVSDSVTNRK